jgi:uncharacterized protein
MTVSLFSFINLFDRQLTNAAHLLTQGAQYARDGGHSEEEMLNWRLIGDMQPLSFQLAVICNFTRQWPARVAGLPVPADIDQTQDVAGFHAAIAEAKAYLAALTPEQFAGRDDVPLTYMLGTGLEATLPSGQWLSVFAVTNTYFHVSTAYGILRAKGVPIGKRDLFAGGL